MKLTLATGVAVFAAIFSTTSPVRGSPTLVKDVRGYTLVADRLETFSGLVFDHGKVVGVGDSAVLHVQYPAAHIIDGRGNTLLPGLIDSHGHIMDLGVQGVQVELFGSSSLQSAQRTIGAYALAHPASTWLLGGGWNQVQWRLGRFPSAQELDVVVSDRPAVFDRVDGHAKWLNTRALHAANITRDTPDPVGGRIEHNTDGSPSGVLVDKAMDLIDHVTPPPTETEHRSALLAALSHMNSVGLTSAGDAGVPATTISLYRELDDQKLLTVRVYAMIGGVGEDFAALSIGGPLIAYGDDRLTVRSVKLFADGALGSRGAALLAPYSDDPHQRGLLFVSDAQMQRDIETALRAGYQVNVHAIGDAANRQVLDAFEAAYKNVGGRQLRNRIEHAQVVASPDIPRFKQLDIIASMQPTHATSDMNMAESRIGAERLKGAYAWRTFLDQGTQIAGGSDFPVENSNPFFGLYSAVTRMDQHGQPKGGWHAEQAMTRIEAFRAFTMDAAYAQHMENTIGSLEPGKWADFILVDGDYFTEPVSRIWKTKVLQTWVAGTRVY